MLLIRIGSMKVSSGEGWVLLTEVTLYVCALQSVLIVLVHAQEHQGNGGCTWDETEHCTRCILMSQSLPDGSRPTISSIGFIAAFSVLPSWFVLQTTISCELHRFA